jgi:hypothetical protein
MRVLVLVFVAALIGGAAVRRCGASASVDDSVHATRLVETLGSYPRVHLLYFGIDLRPKMVFLEKRHRPGPRNSGYSLWLRCTGDRLLDSLGVHYLPYRPPERRLYGRERLDDSIRRAVKAKASRYGWSEARAMEYRLRLLRRSPLVKAVRPGGPREYSILWADSKVGWEFVQIVGFAMPYEDRSAPDWIDRNAERLRAFLPMPGAIVCIGRETVYVRREGVPRSSLPYGAAQQFLHPDLLPILRGERW